LLEGVLDDFTEDVGDGLLNLFVDAHLNVLLGVNSDEFLRLVTVLIENAAVAFIIEVQHVLGADNVAVTSINGVHAFVGVV